MEELWSVVKPSQVSLVKYHRVAGPGLARDVAEATRAAQDPAGIHNMLVVSDSDAEKMIAGQTRIEMR